VAPGGLKTGRGVQKAPSAGAQRARWLRANYPNEVWAIDFQFDETADQRRLKMANVVDEFTRECLAIRVGRSCTADQLIDVLEKLMYERGAPSYLRMDNGPELIAWGLREWCRLSGTDTSYIEPGAQWENPFVESFNGRFRDECLNVEEFWDLIEAQVTVEQWRIEYNTFRPHSALGGLTPAEFAAKWASEHEDPRHSGTTPVLSAPLGAT